MNGDHHPVGSPSAESGRANIDYAELRQKAEAATKGTWHYRPNELDDWGVVRTDPDREGYTGWFIANVRAGRHVSDDELAMHRRLNTDPYERNAAYIVAAQPSTVLALLDRIEELEAAVAEADRLGLVIEAAVRRADSGNLAHIHALMKLPAMQAAATARRKALSGEKP